MKIMTYGGIGLVVVIVLITVLAFVIPNEYTVTRSTPILAPKNVVWEQVVHLKKMSEWSPWAEKDPNMEVSYEGTDGEVGSKMSWTGNDKVGTGTQEITEITNDTIKFHLSFTEPWKSESDAWLEIKEVAEGTCVTWCLEGALPFPMNIFMDMDTMIGKEYERGLSKLKSMCESSVEKEKN